MNGTLRLMSPTDPFALDALHLEPRGPRRGGIVVTAQKRAENINRVRLLINAFNGGRLEMSGMIDAAGLATVVPGSAFARWGSNTLIYTLRGMSFNTRNISVTPPVSIHGITVGRRF